MTPDITTPEGLAALFGRALKQALFLDGSPVFQPPPYRLVAVAEPTLWRELLVRLRLRPRRTVIMPAEMTFAWSEVSADG